MIKLYSWRAKEVEPFRLQLFVGANNVLFLPLFFSAASAEEWIRTRSNIPIEGLELIQVLGKILNDEIEYYILAKYEERWIGIIPEWDEDDMKEELLVNSVVPPKNSLVGPN